MTLGLLHTTESDPGTFAGNYFWFTVSHPEYAPNTLIDPSTRERVRFLPAGVPSKALRNLAGGVETNNRTGGVHQIEIVARAADVGGYSLEWYKACAEMLAEESAYAGVRNRYWGSKERMTFSQWVDFLEPIWYGHENVPENDHWDPGTLRLDLLLPKAPQMELETPLDLHEHDIHGNPTVVLHSNVGNTLSFIHDDTARTLGSVRDLHAKVDALAPVTTNLQTVPDELLLAEVARRFRL